MQNEKTKSAEKEVTITRILNAPCELVFKAWIDVKQVQQWWGPGNFTNPVCELDAKVGGKIYIEMKAPDGIVYPMSGIFKEIIPSKKLVFISAALDKNGDPLFEISNTILFEDQNGKTKLTVNARVIKTTPNVEQYLSGMEEGWSQSLVRLENLISKL